MSTYPVQVHPDLIALVDRQSGKVSNILTDEALNGASNEALVRATTDPVSGGIEMRGPDGLPIAPASPQVKQAGVQRDISGITWTVTQTASAPSVTASSGQITAQPGGGTVRIAGTASVAGQYVRATGALPASFVSRGMEVSVPVFIPDYTKVQSITVAFSSDAFASKQLYCQYTPEFSGLHFVGLNDRFIQGVAGGQLYQAVGGEVSDGTTFTHCRLQLTMNTGSTFVYFGKPVIGARKRARIMLTVDDGESWIMQKLDSTRPYSVFQYCQATGIKMTHFLIYSLIGTAGYHTVQDVQRILDAGHQICPHGATSLAGLANDAARRADVQANINGLKSLGVPESMLLDCYAYPNGVFEVSAGDTTIMQILRDFGFRTARTASRRAFVPIDAGVHRQYHLPILGHYTDIGGGGETEAETLQLLEDLCASGGLGIEVFHKFSLATPTDVLQTKYSSMLLFLDRIRSYINAGSMVSITPSDLVREFNLTVPATNTP